MSREHYETRRARRPRQRWVAYATTCGLSAWDCADRAVDLDAGEREHYFLHVLSGHWEKGETK